MVEQESLLQQQLQKHLRQLFNGGDGQPAGLAVCCSSSSGAAACAAAVGACCQAASHRQADSPRGFRSLF